MAYHSPAVESGPDICGFSTGGHVANCKQGEAGNAVNTINGLGIHNAATKEGGA
jgi:hypothetical protein